jgi:diadenosine tetraphosphate (Ap4A) HIT family hydrolase
LAKYRSELNEIELENNMKAEFQKADANCVFCDLLGKDHEILVENETFWAKGDGFPIAKGHSLIIPKRHITSPAELDNKEWIDMRLILEEICSTLKNNDGEITGFNIGVNIGRDAGQTVPHLHMHVIPRRPNDIPDSRCGVRMINPGKADYTNE